MEEKLSNEYRGKLSEAVLKGFLHAGISKYEAEDIQIIVNKCIQWLDEQHILMSVSDCCDAIDKGVFKEFGEYFGINAVTVVTWFKQFREWKKFRQRPISASHQIESEPKKTALQQSLIDKSFIEECKHKFLKQGHYRDYGQILYDSLKREKVIELNMEIWEAARIEVSKQVSAEKSNRTLAEIVKDKLECEQKDYSKIRIKQKLVDNWLKENTKIKP